MEEEFSFWYYCSCIWLIIKIQVCVICICRLQPASPEELLKAFQTLDKEKKGVLDREMMTRAMMEEGEPFTQEEVDEMMAVAVDPESGNIPYEYYINQIMVNILVILKG